MSLLGQRLRKSRFSQEFFPIAAGEIRSLQVDAMWAVQVSRLRSDVDGNDGEG